MTSGNQFTTNIYGGNTNLAQGSSNVTQTTQSVTVAAGDTPAFLDALRGLRQPEESVEALATALEEEGHVAEGELPGPKTRAWLARTGMSVSKVGGKILLGGAGGVVAGLVKAYFGWA